MRREVPGGYFEMQPRLARYGSLVVEGCKDRSSWALSDSVLPTYNLDKRRAPSLPAASITLSLDG